MTLCERCIHGDVCGDRDGYDEGDERALTYCSEFKSKDDVVEVVRCKDCKYWGGKTYGYICNAWSGINTKNYTKPSEFCSLGKRKEQE